jgi:hypothetical protein
MSIISGGLAKKYLNLPVSLITDQSTVDWMKTSGTFDKASQVFENIKLIDRPVSDNTRRLNDGQESKTVPFLNSTRSKVWDLTPYDETLLIDSDYLIFSDLLNQYWHLADSVLIGKAMNDVQGQRIGFLDKNVSDVGVHLYWATTVMFKKNERSKLFFDLVDNVKTNYSYFADIYRFSSSQFRNDIAFSVAKHILDGFETNTKENLPPVLTAIDKDILHSVCEKTGKLTFLISNASADKFYLASVNGVDVHIINKQSIILNSDNLLELKSTFDI